MFDIEIRDGIATLTETTKSEKSLEVFIKAFIEGGLSIVNGPFITERQNQTV